MIVVNVLLCFDTFVAGMKYVLMCILKIENVNNM